MTQTILAIETSCDETAAAVYNDEHGVLSNVLFSQTELHQQYGGVVPEIASRSHIEKINGIVESALTQSHKDLHTMDAIAVTTKPGLPGSLLVGTAFAKALAYAEKKPIIGVDHLEAHAYSPCIDHDVPFPHICLTASGGHTSLYYIKDYGDYDLLGTTQDDAAGEAFDKIAKLMNLGYPGGPIIEQYAKQAGCVDYFAYPRMRKASYNFSFSGLKTAVLYDLVAREAYDLNAKTFLAQDNDILKQHVASSLLVAITDIFESRISYALKQCPDAQAITFAGGVACNSYISHRLSRFAEKHTLPFFKPKPAYCTDNAAMIAFVGNYKAIQNKFDKLDLDIF
jgi:N6-L-threonylcarbamoyladenine synthase